MPEDDAGRLRLAVEALGLPLILLLLIPVLLARLVSPAADRTSWQAFGWYLPLGAAVTLLAADLALRLASARQWPVRRWYGWAAVLVPAAVLYLLPVFGSRAEETITAAMVICLLCAEVALVAFALYGRPRLRVGLLLGVLIVMAYTNSEEYKLTYPGLDDYASPKVPVKITMERGETETGRPSWKVKSKGEDAYKKGKDAECEAKRALEDGRSEEYHEKMKYTIRCFSDCLHLDPHNAVARIHRARAYSDFSPHGDPDPDDLNKMFEDYKFLVEQDEKNNVKRTPSLFNRGLNRDIHSESSGVDARHKADNASAEFDYRAALDADPLYIRARVSLAGLLGRVGKKDESKGEWHQAAEDLARFATFELETTHPRLKPKSKLFLLKSEDKPFADGVQCLRESKWDAAVTAFESVLTKKPEITDTSSIDTKCGPLESDDIPNKSSLLKSVDTDAGLLNDVEVLRRWCLAHNKHLGRPGAKPKLVVVAVSGGGIVAAGWTARCLVEIEKAFADFPYHVRIITGASGGMVGAARYVATLQKDDLPRRGQAELDAIRDEIDHESLTPVVRRMVLRDLPLIFYPFPQAEDRGRVLERTWVENTKGALGKTFRELYRGEAEGWRPSLIISPLLVEDGAQMVISNLDLEAIHINLHFFGTFPEAQTKLKLCTALRMNAAFPFVTPATSLPTCPPRRVADAGYVDNYGVRLAADWIWEHEYELADHTSGVALVQIRAYPRGLPEPSPSRDEESSPADTVTDSCPESKGFLSGFLSRLLSSFQWLTTPMEGYTMAKKAAMISQNDSLVDNIHGDFDDEDDPLFNKGDCFFQPFVFELREEVPLSWNITHPDRKRLDNALGKPSIKKEIKRLVDFLRETPPEL